MSPVQFVQASGEHVSIEEMHTPQEVQDVLGDDNTGLIVFMAAIRARLDMLEMGRLSIAPGAADMYNIQLEAHTKVLHRAYPEQGRTWWRNRVEDAADTNRQQEKARS